jgi:hypothetical protein
MNEEMETLKENKTKTERELKNAILDLDFLNQK